MDYIKVTPSITQSVGVAETSPLTPNVGVTPFNPDGIIKATEPTELGEALNNLNSDAIEQDTRMSGIDLRARLHPIEISSVLALDALVALKVLPVASLSFSRQKKRLSVSTNGEGRKEIVSVIQGKREHETETGKSLFQRLNPFSKTE